MADDLLILNEPNLIAWLKNKYKEIDFIAKPLRDERHKRTEALLKALEGLDESKWLFEQDSEKIAAVWRNLFGKAIIYLKFKDEREEYHDDEDYGVDKLNEFFETFRHFEPLLYGAEERYRDHIKHALGVFLIGEFLVRNTIGFHKIDVGDKDLTASKISADEKEAMWCVMSLTHDLGIALEKIPTISDKVEKMLKKFGIVGVQGISYPFLRLPLDDFVLRFVSSDLQRYSTDKKEGGGANNFVTHVQSKYFLKFSEAYESRDHGIIGCLLLMKNLVFFLETDYTMDTSKPLGLEDAKQFLIRRNILRAIAAHSNDNIYYLKVNEFPFLLRIFDELHERERPRLVEMFEGKKVETTIKARLNEEEIYCHITFNWKDQSGLSQEQKDEIQKDIAEDFKRKCERIRQILRSAVGGKDRKLILTLEVSDELGGQVRPYKLVHKTPEDITMSLP